jgi:hypothetical protein
VQHHVASFVFFFVYLRAFSCVGEVSSVMDRRRNQSRAW